MSTIAVPIRNAAQRAWNWVVLPLLAFYFSLESVRHALYAHALRDAVAQAGRIKGEPDLKLVAKLWRQHLRSRVEEIGYFVGFVPDEGETLVLDLLLARDQTDRDANLQLGLFTNVSPGETITEATLTEPTGTGYARIALTDGSWSITGDTGSYAQQTFTGGAGGWTGSVQGYFIATNAAGGTPRIVCIEVDGNGPYTIQENYTYSITPNITPA